MPTVKFNSFLVYKLQMNYACIISFHDLCKTLQEKTEIHSL